MYKDDIKNMYKDDTFHDCANYNAMIIKLEFYVFFLKCKNAVLKSSYFCLIKIKWLFRNLVKLYSVLFTVGKRENHEEICAAYIAEEISFLNSVICYIFLKMVNLS